jgi:hypothetical protein
MDVNKPYQVTNQPRNIDNHIIHKPTAEEVKVISLHIKNTDILGKEYSRAGVRVC